jgi:predicted patatin/cPLA2 family phospholipase
MLALAALAVFSGAALQACSHPVRVAPPAEDVALQAVVMDAPHARIWPASQTTEFFEEGMQALEREMAELNVSDYSSLPPASFLAISGGGDEGAFGAGLLVGWTEAGTRPEFKMVTGVSTGALIAPFAFLGPSYDEVLREIYTTVSAEDIFEVRNFTAALFDDAMADTTPLYRLISEHVNDDLLAAIAREYAHGRLLFIGTTNIDIGHPVIWNIGAIASSEHSGARDLVRKILLASAAIPGAFPPVMIDAEVDGKQYQEMHVDGGATAQLFLYPPSVGEMVNIATIERERSAFIIRNGRLGDDWANVKRRTINIAGRAISMMIFVSGLNDVIRTYFVTKRDGVDFNLAYIDDDFEAPERDGDFDPAYMSALFNYGYENAREGFDWQKEPPYLRMSSP